MTPLFVDFCKSSDSIHRGKMEQILQAYESVTTEIMLYSNTKIKGSLTEWRLKLLDIVAGVLQSDTLALYLFIICLDYVHRTSIDLMKIWHLWLIGSGKYTYLCLTLQNIQEKAPGVNADKKGYMCFHQKGHISTLNGRSMKTVHNFKNLGSCISSTESDINICQAKEWTTIDWLSIIWKSNLSDKIKRK